MKRDSAGKWSPLVKNKTGIGIVGAINYAAHPSTRITRLVYDLEGLKVWIPGMPYPGELFEAVLNNGFKIADWNNSFEYHIFLFVGTRLYGWPRLPLSCFYDVAAVARYYSLPGSLEKCGKALNLDVQKDKRAQRISKKSFIPGQAPLNEQEKLMLTHYCIRDVESQSAIRRRLPEFTQLEYERWVAFEKMNFRGCALDVHSVKSLIVEYEKAFKHANKELYDATGGSIETVEKNKEILKFVNALGSNIESLSQGIDYSKIPEKAATILKIRDKGNSASVKKLYSMIRNVCSDGRIRSMYMYNGAHTGRRTGTGPQPQNLPGPDNTLEDFTVEDTLDLAKRGILFNEFPQDCLKRIKGCLRGMFIAGAGKRLICSDFSAIEPRKLAMRSGEQWRIAAFRGEGLIYEESGARLSNTPLREVLRYPQHHDGEHHPIRKLGKVGDIAGGYQGGWRAWVNAGADKFLSRLEIEKGVKDWRKANPKIVDLWYSLDRVAINAVSRPDKWFETNGVAFIKSQDILWLRLPSGRFLKYWYPRLSANRFGRTCVEYSFNNRNPKKGPLGWTRTKGYGGLWTENLIQAECFDRFFYSWAIAENAGYKIVLETHDELCCEVPGGFGSVEELEEIMSINPPYYEGWPIVARGGWEGKRFKK